MRNKAVVVVGVLCSVLSFESESRADPPMRCRDVTFEVALAPDAPVDGEIYGRLCARGSVRNKTMQVLLHGGSYDHRYWDWPHPSDQYSYVREMTAAGYATLSIDRIGTGRSSHPADASAVTLHSSAYTVHQIVQQLRAGTTIVRGFGRVVARRIELVGFSLGSFIATIEASVYDDVDAVVLTAYSHTLGPAAYASFDLAYPANLEPAFADLPDGYLTTLPGVRSELFFHTPGVDPAILALDEWIKQTYTIGELTDIFPSLPASLGVRVPTLLVVGDRDMMSCEAPSCTATGSLANESANYAPEACLELAIIPGAGHSLNLHYAADSAFAAVREWSDRRVGPDARVDPSDPCLPCLP
jgi:pimeloyl-ACP methyl ester carboxylesterase